MTLRQIVYIWLVMRILTISILFLFLFNTTGYYFLFLICDSSNRSAMQNKLFQETSLETIRVHQSELKNVILKENGKEICLNGEMYDVRSRSLDGDYVVFICIHDPKESKLFAGLDRHVQYNSDSKSSSEKKENDKNPVKDLFFYQTKIVVVSSILFGFPSVICPLPSAYLPSLALPPEVSTS